jgi:hypothetical protein
VTPQILNAIFYKAVRRPIYETFIQKFQADFLNSHDVKIPLRHHVNFKYHLFGLMTPKLFYVLVSGMCLDNVIKLWEKHFELFFCNADFFDEVLDPEDNQIFRETKQSCSKRYTQDSLEDMTMQVSSRDYIFYIQWKIPAF